MKTPIHIYLSGPMTGLTVAEAVVWVREARVRLEAAGYECYSPIETETAHLSEDYVIQPEGSGGHPLSRREAFFHFDRHEVKRSGVLYVNVTPIKDDDRYSLGSDWEMCWAAEQGAVIVLVARPMQTYAQHGFIKAAGVLIFYAQEEALRFLEAYADGFSIEKWRPVSGYEERYEVSNEGRIRSLLNAGRILKPRVKASGYLAVVLSADGLAKEYRISRLVALAFLGPRPLGGEVNHKDGDKSNNRLSNLEWLTHPQNMQHASRAGLLHPALGEAHGRARLKEADVRLIRRAYPRLSISELARRFSVDRVAIRLILQRRTWKRVQ